MPKTNPNKINSKKKEKKKKKKENLTPSVPSGTEYLSTQTNVV